MAFPDLPQLWLPVAAAVGLAFLVFSLRAGRRRLLIDNLPRLKTTGVFIGLVDIEGRAETSQPLHSHIAGASCVYYEWKVQERWSRTVTKTETDSDGKSRTVTETETGWTTLAQGSELRPFDLEDDKGSIRIQPEGAEIEALTVMDRSCGPSDPMYYDLGPPGEIANSDHVRSFTEYAIPMHAQLYVIGHARERTDIVAPEIAKDLGAPMFLISTRPRERISRGYRLQFWLAGGLGLLFVAGATFLREYMLHGSWVAVPPGLRLALGSYSACWLLGWVWMVYNSLVELRQRVCQGRANIDVELKRRHDLLTRLVEVVTALRDHERHLQQEVTALRAQMATTPPGHPGPDPSACAGALRGVTEAYPLLKTDASFLNLQKQLVTTEDRIAMAGSYYNEIVTFFNTRIRVVPECYVSLLGGMRPQPLLLEFSHPVIRR